MVEDIDSDLVGEFEGTHRESGPEAHRGIDRLDRDAFLLVNPGGPLEIRPEDARRDESWDTLHDHHDRLAERLREIDCGLEGRVARRVGADDLDERHEHRRVEEMHPDDLLRSLRGVRHLRDRQRGRVRREDRLRRRRVVEFPENLPLQLRVLEDRLDHEVRIATGVLEVDGHVNPSERLVRPRLGDLLLLDEFAARPAYPFEASIAWATFLAVVLVPAASSGFLGSVGNPADWVIFLVAMLVAILYDYYRLNPEKVPWLRSRT